MPAKAPLPPPEDELEAAEAVVLVTVVLADEDVVVELAMAELTAVELRRGVVVELAAAVEEEAIAAAADFDDDVVVKRQIPRAAFPPHICRQTLKNRSGRKNLEAVGKKRARERADSDVPSWGSRSTQSGTKYPARRTPTPRCSSST